MSWVTFTTADVLSQLSANEQAAYAASHGQDRLRDICATTVSEVRGHLAARTALGPTGTIPDALLRVAVALARHYFLNSLPVKGLLTEERVKEYERAADYLRDISTGDVPVPVERSGGMQVVSAPDRLFTRDTLSGL